MDSMDSLIKRLLHRNRTFTEDENFLLELIFEPDDDFLHDICSRRLSNLKSEIFHHTDHLFQLDSQFDRYMFRVKTTKPSALINQERFLRCLFPDNAFEASPHYAPGGAQSESDRPIRKRATSASSVPKPVWRYGQWLISKHVFNDFLDTFPDMQTVDMIPEWWQCFQTICDNLLLPELTSICVLFLQPVEPFGNWPDLHCLRYPS